MVHVKQIWQANRTDSDNVNQLTQIRRWWTALQDQPIIWQQRLLTEGQNAAELDWSEPQRFDESFTIQQPDLRGITLYWQKSDSPERNITVRQLELHPLQQQLFIFPQTQPSLVIRVALPAVEYQLLKLTASTCQYSAAQSQLTLQDDQQHLEVQIQLSGALVEQLKQQLTSPQ